MTLELILLIFSDEKTDSDLLQVVKAMNYEEKSQEKLGKEKKMRDCPFRYQNIPWSCSNRNNMGRRRISRTKHWERIQSRNSYKNKRIFYLLKETFQINEEMLLKGLIHPWLWGKTPNKFQMDWGTKPYESTRNKYRRTFFLVLILRLGKLFPKKIENIKQHERMKLTGLQFI